MLSEVGKENPPSSVEALQGELQAAMQAVGGEDGPKAVQTA